MSKVMSTVNLVITLVVLVVVGMAGWWLYKNWAKFSPGVSAWWSNLFGAAKPGTQIADITGQAGANASAKAFGSVVNRSSQGFYNAALQQYAYDNEFDTAIQAQGTSGWTWKSYMDWKSAGEPHLPGEEAVYSDDNGVWHNDYV